MAQMDNYGNVKLLQNY